MSFRGFSPSGSTFSGIAIRGARSEFFKTFAGLADDHYILKHRDFVAILIENGKDGAFYLGFFFESCFVGLVSKEDVPFLDGIADLLFEFGDYAALHRLALFGHYNNLCHYEMKNYCIIL